MPIYDKIILRVTFFGKKSQTASCQLLRSEIMYSKREPISIDVERGLARLNLRQSVGFRSVISNFATYQKFTVVSIGLFH